MATTVTTFTALIIFGVIFGFIDKKSLQNYIRRANQISLIQLPENIKSVQTMQIVFKTIALFGVVGVAYKMLIF